MAETIAEMMTRMQSGLGRNPDRWLIIGDRGIQWKEKVRIQILVDRMHKYIGQLEDEVNDLNIKLQDKGA